MMRDVLRDVGLGFAVLLIAALLIYWATVLISYVKWVPVAVAVFILFWFTGTTARKWYGRMS